MWITGPAGSGKTTLIASYLENRELPSLWYEFDRGDSDIAAFFYYMGLAVKRAAPRRKKDLALLTHEYLLDTLTFTKRFFEDLYDHLKQPSVIVFDNYQEVPAQSMLHEMLCAGLSGIPEGITVIFSSRDAPPPAMARLLANQQTEFIGWDELHFTENESKRLLKLRGGDMFSAEMMRQIHYATQGWAAGLILILLWTKREKANYHPLSRHSLKEIFDYFVYEIFGKLDTSKRDFLVKSAFLTQMTTHMAASLSGNPHADHILSQLHSKNCFIEKRTVHGEAVYQYHDLFKEFLLIRAQEEFSPPEVTQLHCEAANLLEASGYIEDAAELYIKAKQWERLVQLISRHAESLLCQGRSRTLEGWITSLPEEILKCTPWLSYWMGVSLLPFGPVDARGYFERAYSQFKSKKDAAGLFLSWSFIINSFVHERSNLYRLDLWIKELHEIRTLYPHFPSVEIEAQVTFSMFIALVFYIPEQPVDPPLPEWAERTEMLLERVSDHDQVIITHHFLILYYLYSGNLSKAALLLERLKHRIDHNKVRPLTTILSRLTEINYCCFTGDFVTAQRLVERGLETAETSGVHIYTPHLFAFGVYSTLCVLNLTSASEYLERMASCITHGKGNSYVAEYHYLVAWKAWLTGDLHKACEHSEIAITIGEECQDGVGLMIGHIASAHVLTKCGNNREAASHLDQAHKIIRRGGYDFIQYKWLLAKAQLAFTCADEREGLHYVRKAMSLGREKGIIFIDWFHPTLMTGLCVKALEAGIEVEHVQRLIRKLRLIPNDPPLECELWPWPVRIYTLGRFSVLKDGDPLHVSGRVQKRPLEMLKLLITHGDREVREMQLSDTLWPDADGDMAHRSFATTLHRLRKLLGDEKAGLRKGRLSLDHRYCWVDAHAFERLLRKADEALKSSNRETAIQWMERALSLYHGPFLPGDEMKPWAVPCRERLRNMFLRYTEKLALLLEKAGRCDQAIDWLKRGLEADDLAEGLYQRLMFCLMGLERKAEALAVYHRCKKALATRLGVEPSSKTKDIYISLVSGIGENGVLPPETQSKDLKHDGKYAIGADAIDAIVKQ